MGQAHLPIPMPPENAVEGACPRLLPQSEVQLGSVQQDVCSP